ncbi:MAG: hypothetical protein ACKVP3_13685 [Hyphomicrobiaceae bacterium]
MARVVTVHRKEGGGITVRCGSGVVGFVTRLEGGDERMSGQFAAGPAHKQYAQLLANGDEAEIERSGLHVYSSIHDMRIDSKASLAVEGDKVHFRPASAFIVLRSGGLG